MPKRSLARSNSQSPATPQDHVLPEAQDGEVDVGVAVDVDRVGAGDLREVGDGRRDRREPQRATGVALVAVEGGRFAAAGEVQVGAPVVVAVERGDAAAHEELELTVVPVVDAGGGGVVDEVRRHRRGRPRSPAAANASPPAAAATATTTIAITRREIGRARMRAIEPRGRPRQVGRGIHALDRATCD